MTNALETMSEELYASRVERVYDRLLRARMIATLEKIAGQFRDAGYEVAGPYDLTDDQYRWYVTIEGNGLPELVDVSLELAESVQYGDGTDGVNLSLDVHSYNGELIGGLTPYNYTPDCWAPLRDVREVMRRAEIIEEAARDETAVVGLVEDWNEKRKRSKERTA